MDVDESFSEYVAVRWSMVHRLATLLAGPDDADALARAALVRAYLTWPDVRRSASPDLRVIGLVAGTAARRPNRWPDHEVTGTTGTVPTDGRDRLWSEFGGLLPRQRALLVLRHHEGLSDAEIGDALGCSPDAVATEAPALETGIDVAELRDLFDARSDAVRVPVPPVDELLAEAGAERARRRRRAWRRAGVVAAVLALGLTVASLVQGPSGPEPTKAPAEAQGVRFLSELPSGLPSRIAYAEGRWLYLGSGQQVALDDVASAVVQTRKWLYVAYLSGAIIRIDAVKGTVLPVARSSRGELTTDPGGEHVAWLAPGSGPAVVVLRTAWDWGVLLSDRQRFPAQARCCDDPFVLNGITGNGEVVGSLPVANRAWVWSTPDGGTDAVREISGLDGGAITQVVSDGLVVRHPPGTYAVGGIVAGIFRPTSVLTAKQADFGDPFSDRVVYADDAGAIHVRERVLRGSSRRPGQDVRLHLPSLPQGFAAARWEDPEHVLLDVADASLPHGALVRCDVGTGGCEVAARFIGPHRVAD
jgi:DNA-directed RNA polymerase specialized sigma24 family protein